MTIVSVIIVIVKVIVASRQAIMHIEKAKIGSKIVGNSHA